MFCNYHHRKMASQKKAIAIYKSFRQLKPKETQSAEPHLTRAASRKHAKTTKTDEAEALICDTCKKEFKRRERLERHERLHSGELPFVCTSCGKGFRCKDSLTSHQAVHTDTKAFSCNKCCRLFKTSHELRKHQRLTKVAMSRNEPNDHCPVKCKLCTYQITSKRAARLHMFTHKKKARRPYVCSTCKESFSQLAQLGQHQRKEHEITAEELYCYKCRMVFGNRPELEQHHEVQCLQHHVHQIHSYSKIPSRPYACRRCDKSFKTSSGLGRHLATHFEVDLYSCGSCNSEFEDRPSYETHKCFEQSATTPKPILVVKFLPQDIEYQTDVTPSETSLEQSVHHPALETSNQVIRCQQQLKQTASETHDAQSFEKQVEPLNTLDETFDIQVPVHTLAAGEKPVIIVKFLKKTGEQSHGDIQISEQH